MGYTKCNIDYSEKKKINTTPMIWEGFVGRHYSEFLDQINSDPISCTIEIIVMLASTKRPPDINHNRLYVLVSDDGTIVTDPKTG